MLSKIQKWGDSQVLCLTKKRLSDAQLDVGDQVDISIKDGIMIVTPANSIRSRHSLKYLVKDIPENYQSGHEQKGRRPTLVVCKDSVNQSAGLAIAGPEPVRNQWIKYVTVGLFEKLKS